MHEGITTYIGLDVHKDSISVGILNPGDDSVDVEKVFNDDESIRRLIGRFDDPGRLRACYGGGSHRLRPCPGPAPDGGVLRGHRSVDDPEGPRRQGQDRHA